MFCQDIGLNLPLPLVGGKKEEPVLDNGAAERAAKLIALEIVSGQAGRNVEVFISVEVGIAHEVEDAAMEVIASRLGHHADNSSAVAAILRRVIAGQNAELGDRVRIRVENHAVTQKIVVDAAIQQVSYRIGTSASDVESLSRTGVIGIVLGDARLQEGQTQHIASV